MDDGFRMTEDRRRITEDLASGIRHPSSDIRPPSSISLHRISLGGFLRALAPGGRPAAMQVGIETYLGTHRGRWVPAAELIAWLYADDPDGGPLTAINCVGVAVVRLRQRGVPIITLGQHGRRIA